MELLKVQLDRKFPDAKVPTRGSRNCAGYDLYACEEKVVAKGEWTRVETGIRVEIPSDHYGRIAPRSGLTVKSGVLIGAGVIDGDYRGTLKVVLLNHGSEVLNIRKGDRVAQLILEKIITPEVQVVESLGRSERNDQGFGSTGI